MDTNVFRLFRRALRAYQLYPNSSPVRLDAAAAFLRSLEDLLRDRSDGLSFVFLEDGTFVEGQPVPTPVGTDETSTGAGTDLFNLGVREIRFLQGLDAAEIDRLFDPLARALQGLLNPVDEDLSVLLWEADLSHVWYLLYEERGPGVDEPTAAVELTGGPALEEYLDPRPHPSAEDPSGWARRLGDEDRRRLLSCHRREWENEVPVKYARLLLEILRVERRSDECAVLRRIVENQLETEAGAGRFAVLQRVSACVEPERAPTPGAAWALSEMASWFASRNCLARLLEVRPCGREDGEAVAAMIAGFPAAPLPEGLAAVAERPDAVSPEASAALLRRLDTDPELQALCLRDSRQTLRHAALERIVPEGEDLRRVREILRDRDPKTRIAAVRALGRAKGRAAAGLMDALFDSEAAVRTAAAEALGTGRGREGLEMLLRLMASNGFEEREAGERSAVYLAAGRLAPREVWPILARLAERRKSSWFTRGVPGVDPAIEALAALGEDVIGQARERWRRRTDLLSALEGQVRLVRNRGGAASEGPGERKAA